MPDKRGLNSAIGDIAIGGTSFGTTVPTNMRRYIYKIKTVNRFAGLNLLSFGHKTGAAAAVILDHIGHATEYEMWNDPDEVKEDSAPIYILPAGSKAYGICSAAGNIYVYILYEDSE